jgi:hypothetical protein
MSQAARVHEPVVDWITVVAIAAIAISFTVATHEGVHAIACVAVGGDLQEYSALYEDCDSSTESQAKIVAGSAPIYNLIAGVFFWFVLRHSRERSSEAQFSLWLLTLMNWCYGAGYLIFSGITDIGDWAVVIRGWEPIWLLRVLLTILGMVLFIIFIRLALEEFGKMVGGDSEEQIHRGNKLCILSYLTAFAVVLAAGLFCPYGILSLPVTAGLSAVLGALSPFLWMMRWFRTNRFQKLVKEPLEIHRKWQWVVAATIVVFTYTYILGRTLYF